MDNRFFEHPILNSPYEYPARHWELDAQGQPTQKIIEKRRRAEFITPIPKPKKRKAIGTSRRTSSSTKAKGFRPEEQQYDPTSIINEVRQHVDSWRSLPNPNQWQVTPETARLLQHWRHHQFSRHPAVLLPGGSGGNRHLADRSRAATGKTGKQISRASGRRQQ